MPSLAGLSLGVARSISGPAGLLSASLAAAGCGQPAGLHCKLVCFESKGRSKDQWEYFEWKDPSLRLTLRTGHFVGQIL